MSGHKLRTALLALTLVATTGCTAVVGGVVFVGLVGVGALAYSCDEPVGVEVWDRKTAHTVCDANIVATSNGHESSFSPCYRGYLGTGTWLVTATKPGYRPATGTVTVLKERRCSEPVFHSLELTLAPETDPLPQPEAPAPAPAPVPVPAPEPASPPPLQSAPPAPTPDSPPPLQSAPALTPAAP